MAAPRPLACQNPVCVAPPTRAEELHPTGYCVVCCPVRGDGDCEVCWGDAWEELDDDEDGGW